MPGDRYTAIIDGYEVKCTTISDGFEKSIAEHEFDRSNGALLEDLGLRARRIDINSYWSNEHYEDHKGFLKGMYSSGLVEFSHPVYGPIMGSVKSAHVHHDDGVNSCQIRITFLANKEEWSAPYVSQTSVGDMEESFLSGQLQQTELASSRLLGAVHGLNAAVENGIMAFEGVMANVTIPADSVITEVTYATSLPGRLVEAAANCAARYSAAIKTTSQSPVALVNSLAISFRRLKQSLPQAITVPGSNPLTETARNIVAQQFGISAAMQLALVAAYEMDADAPARSSLKQRANEPAFDQVGNYVPQPPLDSVLNARDLEQILAAVRQFIQEQLGVYGSTPDATATRMIAAIKEMNNALFIYVKKIKLETESIIQVDVNTEMPLQIVCLQHGLPISMVERILSINNIENPAFVCGKVNLYAR